MYKQSEANQENTYLIGQTLLCSKLLLNFFTDFNIQGVVGKAFDLKLCLSKFMEIGLDGEKGVYFTFKEVSTSSKVLFLTVIITVVINCF